MDYPKILDELKEKNNKIQYDKPELYKNIEQKIEDYPSNRIMVNKYRLYKSQVFTE